MPNRLELPPTVKARRTRERILDACLDLFNQTGPAHVTTVEIARTVGIAEGNLHYHFPRKGMILDALFDRYSNQVVGAAIAPDETSPLAYRDYLDRWFDLIWEWRFLFRDTSQVIHLSPELNERWRDLTLQGQAELRKSLMMVKDAGMMHASDDDIVRLATNAWIVASYSIDYMRIHEGTDVISREHVARAREQVIALFLPYLNGPGRMFLLGTVGSDTPLL